MGGAAASASELSEEVERKAVRWGPDFRLCLGAATSASEPLPRMLSELSDMLSWSE